jgi:hypothetical protein
MVLSKLADIICDIDRQSGVFYLFDSHFPDEKPTEQQLREAKDLIGNQFVGIHALDTKTYGQMLREKKLPRAVIVPKPWLSGLRWGKKMKLVSMARLIGVSVYEADTEPGRMRQCLHRNVEARHSKEWKKVVAADKNVLRDLDLLTQVMEAHDWPDNTERQEAFRDQVYSFARSRLNYNSALDVFRQNWKQSPDPAYTVTGRVNVKTVEGWTGNDVHLEDLARIDVSSVRGLGIFIYDMTAYQKNFCGFCNTELGLGSAHVTDSGPMQKTEEVGYEYEPAVHPICDSDGCWQMFAGHRKYWQIWNEPFMAVKQNNEEYGLSELLGRKIGPHEIKSARAEAYERMHGEFERMTRSGK